MTNPRSTAIVIVPVALFATLLLGACSSSGKSGNSGSTTAPTTAATSAATSADASADAAAITATYEKFFDHKTPQTESEKLLQNGPAFKAVIAQQAASPLSKGSSVKVTKVNVLAGGSKATVTFTILIDGSPTLADQGGWAVKEDGTWKVAGTTFCGLVSMTGNPPAVCMDAKSTSLPG